MNIKPLNKCKTLTELFADPKRWTQGVFARDKNGQGITARQLKKGKFNSESKPTCFCFLGGCIFLGLSERDSTNKLLEALEAFNKKELIPSPAVFNDSCSYGTFYEAIVKAGI